MQHPRVGVGVFVFRAHGESHFILGRRKGSHGAGTFALPGGHLELGESFEECAEREVAEETGVLLKDVQFLTATNTIFDDDKHYVTVFMTAIIKPSPSTWAMEPRLLEPEKCEGWLWRSFGEMREMAESDDGGLFEPLINLTNTRPEVCAGLGRIG